MKFGDRAGELWAKMSDIVRLIFPRNTSDPRVWTTQGYEKEEDKVQVYQGLGYAARPRAGANAEAVAVAVTASDHHVIVATRDAALTAQVVKQAGLDAGEVLMFSEGAVVKVREDTVEVRRPDGTALKLPTFADLQSLRDYVAAHVHPGVTTGLGSSGPPAVLPDQPTGTSVLKGQ